MAYGVMLRVRASQTVWLWGPRARQGQRASNQQASPSDACEPTSESACQPTTPSLHLMSLVGWSGSLLRGPGWAFTGLQWCHTWLESLLRVGLARYLSNWRRKEIKWQRLANNTILSSPPWATTQSAIFGLSKQSQIVLRPTILGGQSCPSVLSTFFSIF